MDVYLTFGSEAGVIPNMTSWKGEKRQLATLTRPLAVALTTAYVKRHLQQKGQHLNSSTWNSKRNVKLASARFKNAVSS